MKYILIIFFLISLQACMSTKKKKAYFSSERLRLMQKYKSTDGITYYSYPKSDFNATPIKKRKKRDIDNYIKDLETAIVLHPDSIYKKIQNTSTDSFYFSPNKIKYIQTRNLKSPNMYFVQ
jgi:Holliday junction resolvase RusA-like endonuclease